eukprot:gnl/TRDRNA2_/TRDRNA2_171680_c1_seq3.p1 gnl/TRDRNA2_/TRDRNA2_171680_c1~~gnl/TRDRNA2_/TRDRNA2_171680_c1_seq3.p1  ORF type:complete len:203 (+),score=65.70 gnl/TRDRNA2_/TRDRNA2_171680_c1_seq3:61-669(+)
MHPALMAAGTKLAILAFLIHNTWALRLQTGELQGNTSPDGDAQSGDPANDDDDDDHDEDDDEDCGGMKSLGDAFSSVKALLGVEADSKQNRKLARRLIRATKELGDRDSELSIIQEKVKAVMKWKKIVSMMRYAEKTEKAARREEAEQKRKALEKEISQLQDQVKAAKADKLKAQEEADLADMNIRIKEMRAKRNGGDPGDF